MLACPNGRCGERTVLMGRQSLWYGCGRPEMFSCGGCGEILTLGHPVVADEKGREAARVRSIFRGAGPMRAWGLEWWRRA